MYRAARCVEARMVQSHKPRTSGITRKLMFTGALHPIWLAWCSGCSCTTGSTAVENDRVAAFFQGLCILSDGNPVWGPVTQTDHSTNQRAACLDSQHCSSTLLSGNLSALSSSATLCSLISAECFLERNGGIKSPLPPVCHYITPAHIWKRWNQSVSEWEKTWEKERELVYVCEKERMGKLQGAGRGSVTHQQHREKERGDKSE